MAPISSISGSNAERSRSSNRQAVLGRIQLAGRMGRAEIARALGLSTQAVSNIIAELEEDGLLLETGKRSVGRGLPAVQYGVKADGGYAMGIEIRPDAIFTALVDLHGNAVAIRRRALKHNRPEKIVSKVLKLRSEMLKKSGVSEDKLLGAGIVIPGPFGQTGVSGLGSDLAGWQDIDAQYLFADALELPVELSNDANAAAMSERIAQGLNNFAYLYFGAGLGLGLVNHGQLVAGAFGNAGEIGHVLVMTANGLAPLERQLSRVSVQENMHSEKPLDIAAIEQLYVDRDPRFMTWLESGTQALTQAIGLIENLFDPQTVILGGAMPKVVLDHLVSKTHLPELSVSNRIDNPNPRLQCGTCGRMTATLGAASLILNRAFTPQAESL
jgi:predicted NBD/HSP70 family sugar kinase/biotin operon repressor